MRFESKLRRELEIQKQETQLKEKQRWHGEAKALMTDEQIRTKLDAQAPPALCCTGREAAVGAWEQGRELFA